MNALSFVAASAGIALFVGLGGLSIWVRHQFRYRDYLWERLDPADLPRKTRDHFERQTLALTVLGFRPAGDFLLAAKPMRHLTRVFIGPDPRVFALVGHCADALDVSFQSVFESGIGFESSSYDLGAAPPPDTDLDRLLFQSLPGAEPAELLAAHLNVLDEHSADGDDPIEFSPRDFRKPADYLHRLVHHSLHRQGVLPPVPESSPANVATSV